MSDASASDPYEIVLADLRAQRAQIDQTIKLLEAVRNRPAPNSMPTGDSFIGSAPSSPAAPSVGMGPGAFLGMTIVDAAKKLLSNERRQLTNAEIVDAFKKGGLILNSVDHQNTVGSVLNRRFIQVGDIVRVGRGTWGLKEWYPNRSFKAGKQAEVKEPELPVVDLADVVGLAPEPEEWDLDKGTGNL